MEIVIKRAILGEVVKSKKLGITGEVVDILDYDNCFDERSSYRDGYLRKMLYEKLGDDYQSKYFEVFIQVWKVTKKSNYQVNEIAILSWEDYQSCEIVK